MICVNIFIYLFIYLFMRWIVVDARSRWQRVSLTRVNGRPTPHPTCHLGWRASTTARLSFLFPFTSFSLFFPAIFPKRKCTITICLFCTLYSIAIHASWIQLLLLLRNLFIGNSIFLIIFIVNFLLFWIYIYSNLSRITTAESKLS